MYRTEMEPDTQYLSSGSPPGELRGAKGRIITGGLNIAFGVADIIIPIIIGSIGSSDVIGLGVVVGLPTFLLGTSFILLAITAGCIGISSRRGQCMTVTYLVLCVVLAIFTGAGLFTSAALTIGVRQAIQVEERFGLVNYELDAELGTIYTFLILNTIANALHCVVAIAGASFTCGAVCCIPDTRAPQQLMSVRPVVLQPPPQQQMGVPGATMPPAYTYPVMK